MHDIVWISQPSLWAFSMDKAEKAFPRWTKAWWRKVLEIYLSKGGGTRLEVNDECAG